MEHLTPSGDRLDQLRLSGIPLYPARCRRTHTVRQALAADRSAETVIISGRLTEVAPATRDAALEDESGRIALHVDPEAVSSLWPHLIPGDIVECSGIMQDATLIAHEICLLVPALLPQPESIPPDSVILRARVLSHIRHFFDMRGFIAVDTPTFMTVPDLTPALISFRTLYRDDAGNAVPLYLQTSPEHYMKRLLAAGYEKIYQVCRFYRNGERYPTHNPEFTGLEWYEAYTDYYRVMDMTQELIASLAIALNGSPVLTYQGRTIDLSPPWPRTTVRDAFLQHAGIDLNACDGMGALRTQTAAAGFEVRADDTWDDLFHRVFARAVEPQFPADRPVFVTEYPSMLPSLAKHTPDDARYVERFELYIGGLELANAFTELNDPEEQRRRFESQRGIKALQEGYSGGVDEELLAALSYGMPPSGGIALGVDRLIMLVADATGIDDVLPFAPLRKKM